jgi:hypothetical protein
MPKQKNDSTPSPVEPGTPEPTTDAAEATVSKNAAGAESQAAPTASDRLEDTAPAEPETAAPTSLQDDTPEARTTKDEAGAESQVPAAPSNTPGKNLPPIAEPTSELNVGECFEPFIPQVSEPPAPKPTPKPKPSSMSSLMDKYLRDVMGIDPTPTVTRSETGLPTPAVAEGTGDAEMANTSEILPAPEEAPLPPPRVATAVELFTWITRCFLAQTLLLVDAAELIAFWAISTWFQDVLTVFPCLAITGRAHDAMVVLSILQGFCRMPLLVADFRKGDLVTLRHNCRTVLISEPNLNTRSAALLGNLTNRGFQVVADGCATDFSMSRAIYLGENPATHKIQNSMHIHISPTNAAPPAPPQGLREMTKRIPVHLDQYRNKNLSSVQHRTWVPYGLSSETAATATPLGQGIVDAPELRQKLVALLKTQDQQRLYEMSNTTEAIVVEATWALIRDGREHAYAREIAAKANRLREARDETARLRPENVGHQLKNLGLRTRRISQAGNGLTFDKATVARIQRLAAMYMVEDTPAET